jgi:hypothetical protein
MRLSRSRRWVDRASEPVAIEVVLSWDFVLRLPDPAQWPDSVLCST